MDHIVQFLNQNNRNLDVHVSGIQYSTLYRDEVVVIVPDLLEVTLRIQN
jgi:hypothetical protein